MSKVIIYTLILFFSFNLSNANDNYFLTLRNDKVNLRQGPSFDYPVKIFYKKKFLPVKIIDTFENFRKIKDHENNTGWIHISQLSKKKAAIVIKELEIMFNSPTIYSKPVAKLEKGRLVKVIKCETKWCKVRSDKYKGWIKNKNLWGLF